MGACASDLYMPNKDDGSRGDLKPEVAKLLRHLQLACRFANTTKKDPTILLRFESDDSDCDGNSLTEFVLVAHHCHDTDSRFEATCFRFCMVPSDAPPASGQVDAPFLIRLALDDDTTTGGLWPCINSETALLRRLLALSWRWEISQALNRRATSALRMILSFEPLQYQHVLRLEEEAKVRAAAMRAFRKVMRPPAPARAAKRKGGGSDRRRRPGRSAGGKTEDGGDQVIPQTSGGSATSSNSSADGSKSEDSEREAYWIDILDSLFKGPGKVRKEPIPKSGGVASGLVDPPASAPAPATASGLADPPAVSSSSRRRKGKMRDYLPAVGGGLCFYQVYDGGATGKPYENWILKCPWHANCEKTRGVGAKSGLRIGELEPLAFLHAWRDVQVPLGKPHRQCKPSEAAVDAQMAVNMNAFAGLNAQFKV